MPVEEVPDDFDEDVPLSVINQTAEQYDVDEESKGLSKYWLVRQIQEVPNLRNSLISGIWTGIGVGFFSFLFTKNVLRSCDIAVGTAALSYVGTFGYGAYKHNTLHEQMNTPLAPKGSAPLPPGVMPGVGEAKAVDNLVNLLKEEVKEEKVVDT